MLVHALSVLLVLVALGVPTGSAAFAKEERGCDCTAMGNQIQQTCGANNLTVTVTETVGNGKCDLENSPECEVLYDCTIIGSVQVTTPVGAIVAYGQNLGASHTWDYSILQCGGGFDVSFSIATGIQTVCTKYFARYCHWCTLPV